MAVIADLPLIPLKQVVLEYLRSGCIESDIIPPFVNTAGSLSWQYLNEDEFAETEEPTWMVAQAGACVPLSDARDSRFWDCPIEVRLIAPISATADWVQDAENQVMALLNNICHVREIADLGKRSALAIRLTTVAANIGIPLYCEFTTLAELQRIGLLGERIQSITTLSVLCQMQSD